MPNLICVKTAVGGNYNSTRYIMAKKGAFSVCYNLAELILQFETMEELESYLEGQLQMLDKKSDDVLSSMMLMESWDKCKEHVYLQILNYERNEEYLKGKVYREFLDLAVVCTLECDSLSNEGARYTVVIPYAMVNVWKVDVAEVWNVALSHVVAEGYICESVYTLLAKSLDETYTETEYTDEDNKLFVMTNKRKLQGAYCIFVPGMLKECVSKLGFQKAYVIPSSRHEILLLPVNVEDWYMEKAVKTMIQEVNATQLDLVDFLSNNLYIYDVETDKVSICE